ERMTPIFRGNDLLEVRELNGLLSRQVFDPLLESFILLWDVRVFGQRIERDHVKEELHVLLVCQLHEELDELLIELVAARDDGPLGARLDVEDLVTKKIDVQRDQRI